MPLPDELMKRLLTFTQKCINRDNELVKSVARYAAWYGLHSVAVYFSERCSKYDCEYEDFISLNHQHIQGYYRSVVSDVDVVIILE